MIRSFGLLGLEVHHSRDDLGQQTKLLPVDVAVLTEISVAFTDGQEVTQMHAAIGLDVWRANTKVRRCRQTR